MDRVLAVVLALPAGVVVGRSILLPSVASFGVGLSPPGQLLVTVAPAVLWVVAAAVVHALWLLPPVAVLFGGLVVVWVVDIRLYRIPDRVTFPTLGVAAATMLLIAALRTDIPSLGPAGLGLVLYFAILLVLHVVYPAGLGFGDVKLALPMGLVLGWAARDGAGAVNAVLLALLLGSIVGLVGGVVLSQVRRHSRRPILPDPQDAGSNVFPFGPALAASAVVVTLAFSAGA